MTRHDDLQEQLLRYLDGSLSTEDVLHVEQLLRERQEIRDELRTIAETAVVIADVERIHGQTSATADTISIKAAVQSDAGDLRRSSSSVILVLAGLAVACVLIVAFILQQTGQPEIVIVRSLGGPAEWTGSGGAVTDSVKAGDSLPGGTIELLSPGSWIEFEFEDGSTVSLSGRASMTLSEQGHKELNLRQGQLSASVNPQPDGLPMLVHTPSAELVVIGTQFNVESFSESTHLSVNEGQVRLTRLIDGAEIDVPARHAVTATMENLEALPLSLADQRVAVWQSNLKNDVVCGKWVSDLQMLSYKLKRSVEGGQLSRKEASKRYKESASFDESSGSVWATPSPYGALLIISVTRSTAAPVQLSESTRVRVRLRVRGKTDLRFGMTAIYPDGGFAGKFSTEIQADELAAADEVVLADLALSDFTSESGSTSSPAGNVLTDCWCVGDSSTAKIELLSIEVME